MRAAGRHETVTGNGTAACGTRAATWRDGVTHQAASMQVVRS